MEKIATDIYSFRELRENGFTYVDKTALLLPLCDLSVGKQFFLARPRRFGKSLLVSTMHCLFEGRRELFKGLAIESKWDWSKSWPVLHLDMGSCQAETVEGMATLLGYTHDELKKYFPFPNYEVTDSFLSNLAPVYAGLSPSRAVNYQFAAQEAILAGDADRFVKALKGFFANIPYNLTDRQNEQMWQAIVFVILRAIGVGVNAEVMTNEGRIDMTCETPACIWLIEFKLDRPADEALAQIDEGNYAEKYDFAGKKVTKLGISFSSEKRTIVDVKCKRA